MVDGVGVTAPDAVSGSFSDTDDTASAGADSDNDIDVDVIVVMGEEVAVEMVVEAEKVGEVEVGEVSLQLSLSSDMAGIFPIAIAPVVVLALFSELECSWELRERDAVDIVIDDSTSSFESFDSLDCVLASSSSSVSSSICLRDFRELVSSTIEIALGVVEVQEYLHNHHRILRLVI